MSLFSKQLVYCHNCGVEFKTNFNGDGGYGNGECCCRDCAEELKWKKTLSILGKEYHPRGGNIN